MNRHPRMSGGSHLLKRVLWGGVEIESKSEIPQIAGLFCVISVPSPGILLNQVLIVFS
jgi:hypothetical protein